MKKYLYKIVLIFIVFSMIIVPFQSSAMAETLNSETNYDTYLLENGYPEFLIEEMSENEKKDLFEMGAILESCKSTFYDENGNSVMERVVSDADEDYKVIQRGQIKDTSLKLTWTISLLSNGNRHVRYSYKWLVLPVNRWQDPMGISWNDSYFDYVSGSFYKQDQYEYLYDGTIRPATHSTAKNFANGSDYGITWYADLKGHSSTIPVMSLFGSGSVILKPKKTGTSNIFGKYVHRKISTSISLNIKGYGSFGISGGSGYDEMGNSTAVKVTYLQGG